MASQRVTDPEEPRPRRRPATTPEAREHQVVALAFDLAERQIRAGTASAQVISHFLKLGSSREQLEQERLANENVLLRAKAEALAAHARIEELYGEAIQAMRSYAGHEDPQDSDDSES